MSQEFASSAQVESLSREVNELKATLGILLSLMQKVANNQTVINQHPSETSVSGAGLERDEREVLLNLSYSMDQMETSAIVHEQSADQIDPDLYVGQGDDLKNILMFMVYRSGNFDELHVFPLSDFLQQLSSFPKNPPDISNWINYILGSMVLSNDHSRNFVCDLLQGSFRQAIGIKQGAGWIDVHKILKCTLSYNESQGCSEAYERLLSQNHRPFKFMPALQNILKYPSSVSDASSVVWDEVMKNMLETRLIVSRGVTVGHGPTNCGKTFTVWNICKKLEKSSVVWVDCQGLENYDKFAKSLNSQLRLGCDDDIGRVAVQFKIWINKLMILNNFESLIIVFDHVMVELDAVLSPIVRSALRDNCHVLVLTHSTNNLDVVKSFQSLFASVDGVHAEQFLFDSFSEENARKLAHIHSYPKEDLLINVARQLPGFIVSYGNLPEEGLLALQKHRQYLPGDVACSTVDIALNWTNTVTAVELFIATCIYSPLKNVGPGIVVPMDLLLYLCNHDLLSNEPIDTYAWFAGVRRLMYIGWLVDHGNASCSLSKSALQPSELHLEDNCTTGMCGEGDIVASTQIEAYLNFWCNELHLICGHLEFGNQQVALEKYDKWSLHFEFLFKTISDLPQVFAKTSVMIKIVETLAADLFKIMAIRSSPTYIISIHKTIMTLLGERSSAIPIEIDNDPGLNWNSIEVGQQVALIWAALAVGVMTMLFNNAEGEKYILAASDAWSWLEAKDVCNYALKVAVLSARGQLFLVQKKNEEAIQLFKDALEIVNNNEQEFSTSRRFRIIRNLGKALKNSDKIQEALILYSNNIVEAERAFHENTLDRAKLYNQMAETYAAKTGDQTKAEDTEQALMYFNKALEINLLVVGEMHQSTASVLHSFATFLLNQENVELNKVISYLERAIKTWIQFHGEYYHVLPFIYLQLAEAYDRNKSNPKAIENMKKYLKFTPNKSNHVEMAKGYNKLAEMHDKANDHDSAITAALSALQHVKILESQESALVPLLDQLARWYHTTNQAQLALEYCTESLNIKKKIYAADSFELAVALIEFSYISANKSESKLPIPVASTAALLSAQKILHELVYKFPSESMYSLKLREISASCGTTISTRNKLSNRASSPTKVSSFAAANRTTPSRLDSNGGSPKLQTRSLSNTRSSTAPGTNAALKSSESSDAKLVSRSLSNQRANSRVPVIEKPPVSKPSSTPRTSSASKTAIAGLVSPSSTSTRTNINELTKSAGVKQPTTAKSVPNPLNLGSSTLSKAKTTTIKPDVSGTGTQKGRSTF